MKIRSLFFVFAFLLPVLSFAQGGRGDHRGGGGGGGWDNESSSLSVFSENGEQFLLVLNGVAQNSTPTSRIRVEHLPKYGNDIEVIFADNRTPSIRKMVTIADPVDNKSVDMTLKLSRNREGNMRLKFHKCTEVEHGYHPMRDEYVMEYGHNNPGNYAVRDNTPPPPPAPVPMDARTFNDVKTTIKNTSFDDSKLSTAKMILNNNWFTTDQVIELCRLFSFDDSKLDFAKAAYSRTVDNGSYFKVNNVFSFSSSKESLNEFVSGHH